MVWYLHDPEPRTLDKGNHMLHSLFCCLLALAGKDAQNGGDGLCLAHKALANAVTQRALCPRGEM